MVLTNANPIASAPTAAHGKARDQVVRDDMAGWTKAPSVEDGEVNTSSISIRAPAAESRRRLGSFSRDRRSNRRIPEGTPPGSTLQFGSLLTTATIVSVASSPGKARVPVSISNSTQPSAQMSVRLSTASPRACSGDM